MAVALAVQRREAGGDDARPRDTFVFNVLRVNDRRLEGFQNFMPGIIKVTDVLPACVHQEVGAPRGMNVHQRGAAEFMRSALRPASAPEPMNTSPRNGPRRMAPPVS